MKKGTEGRAGVATVAALLVLSPFLVKADFLTRDLSVGMSGGDVGSLQTFLATDATIYPQGIVSSYFGFLTKAAVSNFQVRNGIDSVGRVGPITRAAINAQMNSPVSVDPLIEGAGKVTNYGPIQPTLSGILANIAGTSATITWNSSIPATARVMYSTTWPFNYRTAASVTSNAGVSTNQTVTIAGLQSNTIYYYVVESLDSQGNFSWSTNSSTFKTQ